MANVECVKGDKCVSCGKALPEGTYLCPKCKKKSILIVEEGQVRDEYYLKANGYLIMQSKNIFSIFYARMRYFGDHRNNPNVELLESHWFYRYTLTEENNNANG